MGPDNGAKILLFFVIANHRDNYQVSLCIITILHYFLKHKNRLYLILSNNLDMNWIDFIIVIILGISLIRGFKDGFVREAASLAALILGIWGAIRFSNLTAGKLDDWFDMTGQYVGLIAFLVTFGIIVVLIHFIGIFVDKIVKAVALGFLNRLLGLVFGLFKAVLIMSVFFVILNAIDAHRPFLPKEKIEGSMFYNPISNVAPALFPIFGEGDFRRSFGRIKKKPEEEPEPELQPEEITI